MFLLQTVQVPYSIVKKPKYDLETRQTREVEVIESITLTAGEVDAEYIRRLPMMTRKALQDMDVFSHLPVERIRMQKQPHVTSDYVKQQLGLMVIDHDKSDNDD